MRRLPRGVGSLAVGLCAACSGDYWLGGSSAGGRSGGHRDAGAGGTAAGFDAGRNARVFDSDVVLRNDDSLELAAGDGGPCRIEGRGHTIRSEGTWTGHFTLRACTIVGLGTASRPAIELALSRAGSADLEENTFEASGAIHVTNDDDSTTTFARNVVRASSVVALDASADATTPAFLADGIGTAQKVFQGNRIERSTAWFQSPNWLIGGSQDRDGNVLVGLRAGFVLAASGLVVRGNYVHVAHLEGSGDEAAITAIYGTVDTLAEHNVLRGGNWVLRGFGGELRYNAVVDAAFDSWLYQPFDGTKVHHNLFFQCEAPRYDLGAGIHLVNGRATGIEIYDNTLDGGGPSLRSLGAAVAIDDGCFLASLRSNLVFGFPLRRNDGGAAAVRPGDLEGVTPPPVRLGYADYNLFFDPDATAAQNYGVAVAGRTLRADAGFGLHDAHAGGPVDEQVDPGPLGNPGACFPFRDEDVENGTVTLSGMLAAFRTAYTPRPGSAALGAGDPADGAGNSIGGVGDGTLPDDRFGVRGP